FSLDHLVGEREQPVRNLEPKCLGGLEVDDHLEPRGLQNWQISRLLTLENPPGIRASLSISIPNVDAIAHQATGQGKFAQFVDGRDRTACRQRNQLIAPAKEEWIAANNQRASTQLSDRCKRRAKVAFASSSDDTDAMACCRGRLLHILRDAFGQGVVR